LISRAACFEGERIVIDRAQWTGEAEVRRRALSVLLAAAAGVAREVAVPALARLEMRLSETGFRGACFGGARLSHFGAEMVISRDLGALSGRADGAQPLPPVPLPVDVETVWDGRLCLVAGEPGWRVGVEQGVPYLAKGEIGLPLGEAGAAVTGFWLLQDRVRHLLGLG
jgi:hypothetical protein